MTEFLDNSLPSPLEKQGIPPVKINADLINVSSPSAVWLPEGISVLMLRTK